MKINAFLKVTERKLKAMVLALNLDKGGRHGKHYR